MFADDWSSAYTSTDTLGALLSASGLGAIVLAFAATLIAAFTNGFDDSLHTWLNAPIGLNELVLAVWLIVKGFDTKAVAALPAAA